MNRISTVSLVVCFFEAACFGQPQGALERLRALRLSNIDGEVPVIYSLEAKDRAGRYRSSLETAHTWYEAQLDISVPVTLAVLDREDWERATSVPYPMPHSKPGLVILPFLMEDFPSFAEMKVDADILAETISFHEMGHLFANKAGIHSRIAWMNELVANIFAQAYIQAHQPDLKSYRPRPVPDSLLPRYTSLADLNYLYSEMSMSNYGWFQFQLNRLAAFVSQRRDLRSVVKQLKTAFPPKEVGNLPLTEVVLRMEGLASGFTDQLGPLSSPTSIPKVRVSVCGNATSAEGVLSLLIVENRTSRDIVVSRAGKQPAHVGAGQSQRVKVVGGEQLRLSTGGCLLAGDEPSLAVIQNPQ